MYNLRYHIASLVAVFLALAMGLLLGTIVVERGVLSSQQTSLVAGLEKQFNDIRTESASVKAANATLSGFAGEVAPQLVAGALTGRTVLIIAAPEAGDTVASARTAVTEADGRTAVVTIAKPGLALSDPDVAAAAEKALGVVAGSLDQTTVVTALAHEWTTPNDPRVLTKAMTTAGGLKLSGLPATGTVGAVVVCASYTGTPDGAALALAETISGGLLPAVGVETTKRADGTAAAAKAAGMSGVDNADTPVGSVSLVWVLAGRANGLFGVGDSVDFAYPSPLFPKP